MKADFERQAHNRRGSSALSSQNECLDELGSQEFTTNDLWEVSKIRIGEIRSVIARDAESVYRNFGNRGIGIHRVQGILAEENRLDVSGELVHFFWDHIPMTSYL